MNAYDLVFYGTRTVIDLSALSAKGQGDASGLLQSSLCEAKKIWSSKGTSWRSKR